MQKAILVFVPIIAIIVFFAFKYYSNQQEAKKYEFTIQSVDKNISLSDFRGKQVLVYFGYSLCPDICPTTLNDIAVALNKLPKNELENIAVIFISLDPQRDTRVHLSEYVKYFHPLMLAGVTDLNTTAQIALNYGVKFQKIEQPNSALSYTLAHNADLYLIDKNGKLESVLPFGIPPNEIIRALGY